LWFARQGVPLARFVAAPPGPRPTWLAFCTGLGPGRVWQGASRAGGSGAEVNRHGCCAGLNGLHLDLEGSVVGVLEFGGRDHPECCGGAGCCTSRPRPWWRTRCRRWSSAADRGRGRGGCRFRSQSAAMATPSSKANEMAPSVAHTVRDASSRTASPPTKAAASPPTPRARLSSRGYSIPRPPGGPTHSAPRRAPGVSVRVHRRNVPPETSCQPQAAPHHDHSNQA
jgi:hypothetical protein